MAKKIKSGGARLIESGKRPVLLGVPQSDHVTLSDAAKKDGRKVTQFLLFHGLKAAKKILGNSS